jgi:hypothetical protein
MIRERAVAPSSQDGIFFVTCLAGSWDSVPPTIDSWTGKSIPWLAVFTARTGMVHRGTRTGGGQEQRISSNPLLRGVKMESTFDRAAEDVGNIVALEHVNVCIPDQQLATLFYVTGLGLTRDPFMMTSIDNMWINVGRSQFHLPTNSPQVLRGHVAIVVPDREALIRRLALISEPLSGTRFAYHEHPGYVEVLSPWGNRIHCHAPCDRFGRITLGMPYVQFDVPVGTAEAIARFYRQIMGAPASIGADDGVPCAEIMVGNGQSLIFRESPQPAPPYDGHHIQIYVADFSGPYRKLRQLQLITEDHDRHQYRFKDIVDPDSRAPLFTIEHEVRSLRHPLFMRPLINRNPAQTNARYAPGRDELIYWIDRND